MINPDALLVFVLSSLALIATPGPNLMYIAARSAAQGRAAGLLSVLGVDCGTLAHVAASACGLSALLVSSPTAFAALKFAGAGYLIYLGWKVWAGGASQAGPLALMPAAPGGIFFQGLLTNVLNPKAPLFFLAFFPQFIDVSKSGAWVRIWMLGLLFTGIGFCVDITVAFGAGTVGEWLRRRSPSSMIQRWLTGGIYVALGVGAALTKV